jgi:sugar lactone lactonase YvrE
MALPASPIARFIGERRDLTQPNGPAFSLDGEHFLWTTANKEKYSRVRRHAGWKSCKTDFRDEKGNRSGVPNGIKVDGKETSSCLDSPPIWQETGLPHVV